MDTDEMTRLSRERFEHTRPPSRGALPPVDTTNLPRGPRLPVLVQSAGLLRFRHQFVPWLRKRYGDEVTLRLLPAGRALVLFARPEVTKEIFGGDPDVFHAGKGNAILGPVMGEHSVLILDGEAHKRARRMLMPAFSGHALRGYRDVIAGLADNEVSGWRPGQELRALDRMNALTLEVILHVVFGVTDEERLRRLRPLITRTVNVSPVVLLAWTMPFLQRYRLWREPIERLYELDREIYAEIAARREAPDLAERSDVLSQLIRLDDGGDTLSDSELRDHLVTLLLAGHETTATALAWALQELGSDPDQLRLAREAALTGDDGWLEAVFKESIRLHPVIAMVVRTLTRPTVVGGRAMARGTTVGPSILLSHSDPARFPDPGAFRPDRFTGDDPPSLTDWIPFGGGARRCLGAAFAQMEAVEVLRAVLSAYDVTALGDERPKVRNITSVPRNGARIRVDGRSH